MTGEALNVTANGLNLRELPDPGAAVLVVLPKGQTVRRLDDRVWYNDWLRIETEVSGTRYNGYVAKQHLRAPGAPGAAIGAEALSAQFQEALKIYGRKTMQMILSNKRKANLVAWAPVLAPRLAQAQITAPTRLAHFFGQTSLESHYYATLQEYASGADYEGRRDLGNTEPGDGKRFKGRGLIQLTGRSNYTRASQGMGLGDKLVLTPEIVADDVGVAMDTAIWFWTANNINAVCDRTGTLADVSLAVSRAVNTGDPDSKKTPNHKKERLQLTESALEAFAKVV